MIGLIVFACAPYGDVRRAGGRVPFERENHEKSQGAKGQRRLFVFSVKTMRGIDRP